MSQSIDTFACDCHDESSLNSCFKEMLRMYSVPGCIPCKSHAKVL